MSGYWVYPNFKSKKRSKIIEGRPNWWTRFWVRILCAGAYWQDISETKVPRDE